MTSTATVEYFEESCPANLSDVLALSSTRIWASNSNAWVRLRHPDYDVLRQMLDTVGQTVKVYAR